jgi:transposase
LWHFHNSKCFFGSNSKNSSKAPSQDPFRKKNKKEVTGKKRGAQKGHVGKNLQLIDEPDEVIQLKIDSTTLPKNKKFTEYPPQKRQEFNIRISKFVTEYQAQVLVDNEGKKYVAPFPKGVDNLVQYGASVRGMAVYLSNYQMLRGLYFVFTKKEVEEAPNKTLSLERIQIRNSEYDSLLEQAELQCPLGLPDPALEDNKKKKRGRQKKSKSRNLLERLKGRKAATLLFMENNLVPFTNNLAERDLRMTKVQQKISGCFRSEDGASDFCRIRSFISTCLKQGEDISSSLTNLFHGKLPEFVNEILKL